ncbi:MAG: hypothetical protein K5873_05670, partial [Treponema sp.]|nr:hypothetical protein [Treponema sp.]
MKNIVNTVKIIISSIALAGLFFTSCSNINTNINSESQELCRVCGSLSLGSGRAASASLPQDLSFKLSAAESSGGQSQDIEVKDLSFSALLPSGEWNFTLSGQNTDASVKLSGSISVKINGKSDNTNIIIPLKIDGNGSGSLNLSITDESLKLSKLVCTLISEEKSEYKIEADFSEGKAVLNKSELPQGFYTANLFFYDEKETVFYSCKEIISIISSLTTDSWAGTSSYMKEGNFILTQEIIDNYRMSTQEDDIVIWNRIQKSSSSLGLNILHYVDKNTCLNSYVCKIIPSDSGNYIWCQDNDGNYYIAKLTKYDGAAIDHNVLEIYRIVKESFGYFYSFEMEDQPLVRETLDSSNYDS